MYHLEVGQDIQLAKDTLYVSTDNRQTWIPLHKFSYVSHLNDDVDMHHMYSKIRPVWTIAFLNFTQFVSLFFYFSTRTHRQSQRSMLTVHCLNTLCVVQSPKIYVPVVLHHGSGRDQFSCFMILEFLQSTVLI